MCNKASLLIMPLRTWFAYRKHEVWLLSLLGQFPVLCISQLQIANNHDTCNEFYKLVIVKPLMMKLSKAA